MDVAAYLTQYGLLFMFVFAFLEQLNVPGFSGGVMLPVIGAAAAKSGMPLMELMALSITAGLLGSSLMYCIGRKQGVRALSFIKRRFPKSGPRIDALAGRVQHGYAGLFLTTLTPVARTLVALPAGMAHVRYGNYLLCAAGGIVLWNVALMGGGYLLAYL